MHSKEFDQSYFSIGNEENKSIKNHVIIIDEINRGNVSAIFGELITLIEPDKREGNKEALSAILPYSKEPFEVPNNLFIIGTMNTADRSVEALDTALRRRFSFEEMLPKPELLKDSENDLKISLEKLLTCINDRIEALIDRDHTIGHSYLINVKNMTDLRLAFKDKIIPLLQEYFYGDYGKIGLVLGKGFIHIHDAKENLFANFDYDGSEGLAQNKFELISFEDKDFNFEKAIETLLNKSSE
jgi:5-methylcytosine-specific restriction protein B